MKNTLHHKILSVYICIYIYYEHISLLDCINFIHFIFISFLFFFPPERRGAREEWHTPCRRLISIHARMQTRILRVYVCLMISYTSRLIRRNIWINVTSRIKFNDIQEAINYIYNFYFLQSVSSCHYYYYYSEYIITI